MNQIEKSIHHIENIHSGIYTKTFNKELLAGKKSLLRINKKEFEDIRKERKTLMKERIKLLAEIRAYEKIVK